MRFHIFTGMIVLKTEPRYLYYILQFFHKNLVIKYNLEDFKDRIRIEKKIASKGGEYKNWDKKKNVETSSSLGSLHFTNL